MIEFAGHDSLLIAAKGGLLVLDKNTFDFIISNTLRWLPNICRRFGI